MHWTISKKILLGYGISIALILFICGNVYVNLRSLREDFAARTKSHEKLNALEAFEAIIRDAETSSRGFVITGNEDYLAPNTAAHAKLAPALQKLVAFTADDPTQAPLTATLQEAASAKMDTMDETIKTRRAQGFEAAAAIVASGKGKHLMESIQHVADTIRADEDQNALAAQQRVTGSIDALTLTMEVGAPIAFLLMIGIGIYSARSISEPLRVLTTASQRIARGEVQVEIPAAKGEDEVSQLARSFEQMVATLKQSAAISERIASGDLTVQPQPQGEADLVGRSQADMVAQLSSLIGQVQQSGVQVNSSAVEIAAVAKQQQATASEVASTTTEISSTAREMSATSTELLKSADQVSIVASETATLATQGKASLNRIEAIIRQITEASGTVTNRLGVMNEKAANINTVVTTITKVADQTNLLSLNAAIEAEKAGEYGKGFAVVATEIRRLADQTAASTSDIERIVKELVSAVSAGVMGMDKFSEEVRRGASEISDTRQQLDEVVAQVQSLAPSVETLHEGMRAQTQGAEQISDALSQLGEAARQTSDSIRDSSRAVEQLNDATRGLQGAISRFKIRS
jgi:methyl-accepting chemotaxis protein WspA